MMMLIQISDRAKRYLERKIAFYRSARRVPRIIIAERSCSGAVFRLFFDAAAPDDIEVVADGVRLYIPNILLEEFGGFVLDVEQFFFTSRFSVMPMNQSFRCNCDAKCQKPAISATYDKGSKL